MNPKNFINKKKINVIYILSAGHSGSTLLDLILGSHSQIVGIGELNNYYSTIESSHDQCSCGKKLDNCEFWNKVMKNSKQPSLKIDCPFYYYLLGKDRYLLEKTNFSSSRLIKMNKNSLKEYIEQNEEIYSNIANQTGKKFIVDSSKCPIRAEILLKSKKINFTFIHLVRNGKGVTWSYKRKYGGVITPMLKWVIRNLTIEKFRIHNENLKIIFLRYEDFVNNPKRELKRILKVMHLPYVSNMLEFKDTVHHQAGGNRLRLDPSNNTIKKDSSWKYKLPILDQIIFNILFGWLNIYYKYNNRVNYDWRTDI
ncbi:MAG: sulfotransferase [Candidatus Hodarchaeota archaeon]